MEQKAKRIGKLNIIDLHGHCADCGGAGTGGVEIASGKTATALAMSAPMTKVTYQVKVEGVAPELYENCLAHLPSPLMASGALVGGQIEAVEKQDYRVLDANGSLGDGSRTMWR